MIDLRALSSAIDQLSAVHEKVAKTLVSLHAVEIAVKCKEATLTGSLFMQEYLDEIPWPPLQ
jgi:hypothetical protein